MSSLLAERGPIHVNVGATLMLEGEPPDARRAARARRVAPRASCPAFASGCRRPRCSSPTPCGPTTPASTSRWHVRHTALPRPGTMAQLRELVGRVMSTPLDLERPLWQLYLVEGLEGGRHAYISKTHHALVDGVSAVDVGTIMLDPNPEGTEMPIGEERWDPDVPSPELLFVRAASDRIRAPLRAAAQGGAAARSACRARPPAASCARRRGSPAWPPAARTAPRTFLNQEIGRDRRVALREDRADAAEAGPRRDRRDGQRRDPRRSRPAGCAACSSAAARRCPDQLVALVPMSIRRRDEHLELGNRIATLMVSLPLVGAGPGGAPRAASTRRPPASRSPSRPARHRWSSRPPAGRRPTINRVLADVHRPAR